MASVSAGVPSGCLAIWTLVLEWAAWHPPIMEVLALVQVTLVLDIPLICILLIQAARTQCTHALELLKEKLASRSEDGVLGIWKF